MSAHAHAQHSTPHSLVLAYTTSKPTRLVCAQALQQLRASTQVQDLADVRERMAAGLRALEAHGTPHAQYGAGAGGDGDAAFLGAAVVKTVEAVGRMQAAGAACAPGLRTLIVTMTMILCHMIASHLTCGIIWS